MVLLQYSLPIKPIYLFLPTQPKSRKKVSKSEWNNKRKALKEDTAA